ncbi:MAG: sulfatase, partial [Gemmatimonadetes bacterium]|nr:sulfatase [Gemmatimonadota bacterium]
AGSRIACGAPDGALERAARAVAVLALPAVLLAVPAALRIIPALQPPVGYSVGSGDTNLLLLTVDTLRPDRMGTTGSPHARTPWIDRLSRGGTVFADCQSAAPWTLPSLGTVLTGTYPGEHRVLEEISGISADVPTLAEACRDAGRRTAAFVSNPWLAPGGLARGFETFDVAERLECLSEIRTTRLYSVASRFVLRTQGLDSARRISTQGSAWVQRGEGAWFLWLHYFDPHLPNWPQPPYDRLFGPPPAHTELNLTVEAIREGDFRGGEEGREEIDRLYDGEVAFTDVWIGELWRDLEQAGEAVQTALVFSSDHGEEFWDHDGYGHGHEMYDEVVRVPLMGRLPDGSAAGRNDAGRNDAGRNAAGHRDDAARRGSPGAVVGELVATVDIARTACAAAGIDGARFRGRNRLQPADAPTVTYGEATLYGEEQKVLRTADWKMIYTPADDWKRLFNVRRDPGEQRDVFDDRPAVADSLFRRLEELMALIGSDGAMSAHDPDVDPDILEQLKALGYVSE